MIAALYVAKGGVYYGLPDVDPWDEERDARLYAGPWPVVAHPPCARWCVPLAYVNQTRYGHRVGDDGGCFESALHAVRRWGGILEHPANTAAWRAFGLPKPPLGRWKGSDAVGWVTDVSQVAYGCEASKRTWLYAHGMPCPQPLNYDRPAPRRLVSALRRTTQTLPRLRGKAASATPPAFRDVLLNIARSVPQPAQRTA
jgi:hypothetical protein